MPSAPPIHRGHVVALAVASLLLASCGGGGATPPPITGVKSLVIVSGDAQSARAGTALPAPLVVQVRSGASQPSPRESVSFKLLSGNGILSAATVVTGDDGRAQVTLTVDTIAGPRNNIVTATVAGVAAPATFTAASLSGPVAKVVVDTSTNDQIGAPANPLRTAIAVGLKDSYGNPVVGTSVSWRAVSGGGTFTPPASVSDDNGRASSSWLLGPGTGPQAATATVVGATVAPAALRATSVDIVITSVSPNPMIEGQAATISGRGFSPVAANNVVSIGRGSIAAATASATQITFTVPSGSCQPAGAVNVSVTTSGVETPSVSSVFRPSAFFDLAPGQFRMISDPQQFCLQFDKATSVESYLVGILNSTDDESGRNVTSASLIGEVGASATPLAASVTRIAPTYSAASPFGRSLATVFGSSRPDLTDPAMTRRESHRVFERRFREAERRSVRSLWRGRAFRRTPGGSSLGVNRSGPAAGVSAVPVMGTGTTIGTVYPVKVINLGATGSLCSASAFTTVSARVRAIGTKGIWLEDTLNTTKLGDADYQSLSDRFDTQIYATDVGNWGEPTDIDANGRVAILVSRKVNEASADVLGFVFSGDLFPATATGCLSSNVGEIYYAKAPGTYTTPSGSNSYTVAAALNDAPLLIAHEFTHIIQNSRRLQADQDDMESWEKEGGATLSEEINGWDADGLGPRNNYGLDVAYEGIVTAAPIQWYVDRWTDMTRFFGFNCTQGGAGGGGLGSLCAAGNKVTGAPENCTFFDAGISPCMGGRDIYGNPATLLRWVVDQYGATGAGDASLLSGLISSGQTGLTNVANRAGIPVDRMLAQYYASLYTDDRPELAATLDDRLKFKSWNLYNIYYGSCCGGVSLTVPTARRLTPHAQPFGVFTDPFAVRAVSSSYTVISGTRDVPAAVRARAPDATSLLPATTRLWVVRLQ